MSPDALDSPGDVLAQPTRARLFKRLAGQGGSAGTAELARELGLHPSGVRVHLERLRGAGLVTRETILQSRGRPRHAWHIAPDALPQGEPTDPYRQLARWLARSIPPVPARLREAERAGRELGTGVVSEPGGESAEDAMGRALASLGFAPRRDREAGGQLVFTLGNCPYRDAVRENQPIVCALHRGLTRGLLDVLCPSARLAAFIPRDPDEAGCQISVEGVRLA